MLTQDLIRYPLDSPIPQAQIDSWFEADITRSVHLAQNIVPGFNELDDVRQQVCVTLTFNLGNGLDKFTHFKDAMQHRDWQGAAYELQHSLWASQVHDRATQTCAALINGFWNFK